jgi:DNA-binding HxlR family transcriptional regulator
MKGYGQFCPVAKATELIGEKWTLLILRELLLGTTRFNDFQRAMSRYEYRLTAAGKELSPLVEILAVWGMRWARGQLTDDELDVEFLMREVQRRLQTEHLPDGETVICFIFDELTEHTTWWLLVDGDVVDLCTEDPGKDVDLYVNASVRTMVEVWEGDLDLRTALRNGSIKAHGSRHLVRTMPEWFGICLYQEVRRGDPEMMRQVAE